MTLQPRSANYPIEIIWNILEKLDELKDHIESCDSLKAFSCTNRIHASLVRSFKATKKRSKQRAIQEKTAKNPPKIEHYNDIWIAFSM